MLFNSIGFAIFLPVVFLMYWLVVGRSLRLQNILLLISSYFFYACWDWRFLFLLIFSTLLDYYTGLAMNGSHSKAGRRFWFWLSVGVNLGFLAIFKYYNFFAQSFQEALGAAGVSVSLWTLQVILPVGISFYTFHGLSYVIDIYNDRIKPIEDFVEYSVFVSFFPLLVAGPIERATHLLPQIQQPRQFTYAKAVDGLRQILWGLFKKVVIADNCAGFANQIFNNSTQYHGTTLLLGALFFTFQIYCDFSGYSDIALGTARLFGIELLRNFAFPYFARDIAEFWRRWHISLTTWFRDYLYIPLGGSHGGLWAKIRNTFIIFIVSGFWHGANWTFIAWGVLNALYFIPLLLQNRNRHHLEIVAKGRILPRFSEVWHMATTFIMCVFAWIFFRAESMGHAIAFVGDMVAGFFHKSAYAETINFYIARIPGWLPVLVVFFILIEWVGREQRYALENLGFGWPKMLRLSFYYGLVAGIVFLGGAEQQFIYFQF